MGRRNTSIAKDFTAPVKTHTKIPPHSRPFPKAQTSPILDTPQSTVQMKPMVQRQRSRAGGAASPELEQSIQRERGKGKTLSESLRNPLENALSANFSGVRIHTDKTADQLNQSIQAKAFTTGQDVFFRQGAYAPGSKGGQELLAHELTHVVQQSSSAIANSTKNPRIQRVFNENDFVDVPLEPRKRRGAKIQQDPIAASGRPQQSMFTVLEQDTQSVGGNIEDFFKFLETKQANFGKFELQFLSDVHRWFYQSKPSPEQTKIYLMQIDKQYIQNSGKFALNDANMHIIAFKKIPSDDFTKKLQQLWKVESDIYGNDLAPEILARYKMFKSEKQKK